MTALPEPRPDAATLLPPTPVIREQLALALRDVEILRSLLRIAERTYQRDGLTSDAGSMRQEGGRAS